MKNCNAAVEKHREIILSALDYIWKHPQTGFREELASEYMADAFEKLGYKLTKAGNIPGFYTVLDTGRPGPEILVMGELDSLICPEHPDADSETGAVHCCGHAAQCAALLGVAAALKEPDVIDGLCGRIRLCAVPAEEMIEIEYRTELKKKGIINYLGGKSEFLYRGFFDGVDIVFLVHTTAAKEIGLWRGQVGCIAKRVVYKGVSAHAGGAPWDGCNALYAATLGLSAINSIRETFKDPDLIRVHPIITKGGDAVNSIPDTVVLESFVRGKDFKAMHNANSRINRALCGAALSLGANIEIEDIPGSAPLNNDLKLQEVAAEASKVLGEIELDIADETGTGSSDIGDMSTLFPTIHPTIPGASGKAHGKDFVISDPELACVGSAKWQVAMLRSLLENNAARAKEIIDNYKPMFKTKDEYFAFIDNIYSSGERITYTDGSATVKL